MKELNTILVIEDDQDMASLVKNFLNPLYPAADIQCDLGLDELLVEQRTLAMK